MMNDLQLHRFLSSKERQTWLTYLVMEIYVRKSISRKYHGGDNRTARFLEVANINHEDRFRRKGLLTLWMDSAINLCVENYHDIDGIYVESVVSPDMDKWLERYRHGNYGQFRKVCFCDSQITDHYLLFK